MRIHDKLTFLVMHKRRDLLFFMCGAGGGKVSKGYCGECLFRLCGSMQADTIETLNITTEARLNHACHNCERAIPDSHKF